MDQTAIKSIQDNATALQSCIELARQPRAGVLVPDNMKVHDLEQHQQHRARFRGVFSTPLITEFVAYSKDRTVDAQCFVDVENMVARTIFNMGNDAKPGHCDDVAALKLEKTSEYIALLARVEARLDQRMAAEFLDDFRANLEALDDDGKTLELPKSIAAIRHITIESKKSDGSLVGNFTSQRTAMEEIEAKGVNKLPAFFRFSCVPYEDLKKRDFVLRVSVINNTPPVVTFRIVQAELHKEQMAQELRTRLQTDFSGTKIVTRIGTFKP